MFHHYCATRCHILRQNCTKFDFGWGSAADPLGELTALPRPGCKGSYFERKGREGHGREGEGKRLPLTALTITWPTVTVTCPCSPRTHATLKQIRSSSSSSSSSASSASSSASSSSSIFPPPPSGVATRRLLRYIPFQNQAKYFLWSNNDVRTVTELIPQWVLKFYTYQIYLPKTNFWLRPCHHHHHHQNRHTFLFSAVMLRYVNAFLMLSTPQPISCNISTTYLTTDQSAAHYLCK